ncbi:MAG: prolipoprotein diacylglyceryl transferase family protein [Anaerovoracaceae bacterium]
MDLLFVHWNMNPEIFRIGSFAVRWYGLLFVSGFILGYWIFARFFKREKVNEALLDPLLYTLLIGTLVGRVSALHILPAGLLFRLLERFP